MDAFYLKLLQKLAYLGCLFSLLIISLGAYVRLTHAGLGCPDWPTCYGHLLWPITAEDKALANIKFLATPVDDSKTWSEQLHRLLATCLGVLTLIFFFIVYQKTPKKFYKSIMLILTLLMLTTLSMRIGFSFFWQYDGEVIYDTLDPILFAISLFVVSGLLFFCLRKKQPLIVLSTLLVCAVILQGFFGLWTVSLKLWPQVVSLHLVGGISIAALFFCIAKSIVIKPVNPFCYYNERLKKFAYFVIFFTYLQIFLGGWLTANYAGIACPDFPTCQGQWIVLNGLDGFNFLQTIGPNYLGGELGNIERMTIHWVHRFNALLLTLLICVFFWRCLQFSSLLLKPMLVCLAVLIIQIGLGIANIVYQFPISIAVLHTLTAALLLISIINLSYPLLTAHINQPRTANYVTID